MKVLYVASEAVPFCKTGGLADVAGSLPKALKAQGVDVRVVIPKFSAIKEDIRNQMEHVYSGSVPVSWRTKFVGIDKYEHEGVTYYFVDNEEYFYRDGFYGYDDDAERFSFFCRAILNCLEAIDFWPDVINANDWHAALIPVLLKLEHQGDSRYENIKTIFTIHNLKYQGVFSKTVMGDVLGLDWQYFNNGDLEFYDAVNFMKGGIIYADFVSTVSKTYAQEIQYEYFGEHLDGLLRKRRDDLYGIVNGIDYDKVNPATDKYLFVNYDNSDKFNSFERKCDNKEKLQEILGLPRGRKIPMVSMVTRLVAAKGLDLVVRIMDELLQHENLQFVLLQGLGVEIPQQSLGEHHVLERARATDLRIVRHFPYAVELRAVRHRTVDRNALRCGSARSRDRRLERHRSAIRQVCEDGQRLCVLELQCA